VACGKHVSVAHIRFTAAVMPGSWMQRDAVRDKDVPAMLLRFIKAGPAPVFIGAFGVTM